MINIGQSTDQLKRSLRRTVSVSVCPPVSPSVSVRLFVCVRFFRSLNLAPSLSLCRLTVVGCLRPSVRQSARRSSVCPFVCPSGFLSCRLVIKFPFFLFFRRLFLSASVLVCECAWALVIASFACVSTYMVRNHKAGPAELKPQTLSRSAGQRAQEQVVPCPLTHWLRRLPPAQR